MDKIDLLGGNINIYHNGKDGLRTGFGGVLTLLLLILFGLAVFSFGSNFFKRTNPQSSVSTDSPIKYPLNNINKNNFTFAFRIEDSNGISYRDDSSVYLVLMYTLYSKDSNGIWVAENTKMNITTCTEEMIVDKEFALRTDLETLLCIDFNNNIFGGFWDDEFIARFMLHTFVCEEGKYNLNNNQKCKTDKEKEETIPLNKLYMSMYYQHTLIDVKNYEKGLRSIIKNDYYRIDKYLFKLKYLFFKETILKSDYGWLIEDEKNEKVLGFASTYLDIVTSPYLEGGKRLKGLLATTVVYGSREREIISRKYAKIQTLAAEVGGILKFFISAIAIFAHQYAVYNTQLKFSNLYSNSPSENDDSRNNFISNIITDKVQIQFDNNLKAIPNRAKSPSISIHDQNKEMSKQNLCENNLKNSVDKIQNNYINSEQINENSNKREFKILEMQEEKSICEIRQNNDQVNKNETKEKRWKNILKKENLTVENFIPNNVTFKVTFDMFFALNVCHRSFYKEKYHQFRKINKKFIQNFQVENIIIENQCRNYLKA